MCVYIKYLIRILVDYRKITSIIDTYQIVCKI